MNITEFTMVDVTAISWSRRKIKWSKAGAIFPVMMNHLQYSERLQASTFC